MRRDRVLLPGRWPVRELVFIPEWYTAVQRRKRLLKLQLWVTVVVALSLAAWSIVNAQSLEQGLAVLDMKRAELQVSSNRVHERTVQQQLREQLQNQDRVESLLGLNVEASRLLQMLDQAMPKVVSLTNLSVDTIERVRPLSLKDKGKSLPPDRRMHVSLRGAAPTTADIAAMYENLTNTGVCEDLRLNYARERVDSGHTVREFELQFSINLNTAEGGRS